MHTFQEVWKILFFHSSLPFQRKYSAPKHEIFQTILIWAKRFTWFIGNRISSKHSFTSNVVMVMFDIGHVMNYVSFFNWKERSIEKKLKYSWIFRRQKMFIECTCSKRSIRRRKVLQSHQLLIVRNNEWWSKRRRNVYCLFLIICI